MTPERRTFIAALLVITGLAAPARAQLPHGIPAFCAAATVRSVASGAWSAPATWSTGRVPAAGDVVMVESGHAVSYGTVSDASIACVGVAGQLAFTPTVNTRLKVGTLQVLPSGSLTVGTVAAPINAGVIAEIIIASRPLNTAADPEQYGTGLIVFGVLRMHGSPKTPYVRLTAEASKGATVLQLAQAPTAWLPGERQALPDSKQWQIETTPYVPEWEVATLASLSGAAAALAAPLQFTHPGGRNADGVLEFLPHVANLTRNVIVRSEAPTGGTRGHVIVVARADVDVRWTAFRDLGRTSIDPLDSTTFDAAGKVTHVGTNQIGRYAMHVHHVMGPTTAPANGRQFTLIGNVIEASSKWGLAIHQSHYGLIQDNVIYNALGAGVMLEDGNESFNVIERNLVAVVRGTGQERADARTGEFGYEGSAFWLHGPNNYVRNNIGASTNAFGYTIAMLANPSGRIPKFPGADLTIAGQYDTRDLAAMPLLEFSGNELYGSANGVTAWNLGAVCCESVREVAPSVVKNMRLWHISRYGFYGYGQNKVEFDGWVQRGSRAGLASPYEMYQGFFFSDYITRNLIIRNSDLQNLKIGVHVPPKSGDTRDIYGAVATPIVIENTVLKNLTNIRVSTPWGISGGGGALPPRRTVIRSVLFGAPAGFTSKAIVMAYESGANANPNFVQRDEVQVVDFNRVAGQTFNVFYQEQRPDFIVPQSSGGAIGAPAAGLTNAQSWAQFRLAVAGAVAPCAITRPEISGFVCSSAGVETPPSPIGTLRVIKH
jgi:hypothetical protein